MRFNAFVLIASTMLLGACGGGDANTNNDTGAAPDTTAGQQQTGAATGTPKPPTGTTHTVNMIVDAQGQYKFEPAQITVKQGDAVKWVMVSGAPHNVAFQNVQEPAKSQLSANMPNQAGELSSPMLMNQNEEYTISFAGVPAGTYDYVCTPHMALGMTGQVTVTQ